MNILETFERYRPNFERLNLHVYGSTNEEDLLLFKWWMLLNETGDINRLVNPEHRRLALFFTIFQQPTITFYSLDKNGEIDSLIWFKDPSGESIFCGLWFAQSTRATKRAIHIVQNVYSLVFEFYTTIFGLTWQSDLLQLHQKIGYNIVGTMSNFMGQSTCYLMQLLATDFRQSRLMQIGRK